MTEATSHHYGQLNDPSALSVDVGPLGPRTPSKKTKIKPPAGLGIQCSEQQVEWSSAARSSHSATCMKGDMVLFKAAGGGGTKAGKVQLHLEVGGAPVSLVSIFSEKVQFWM